MTRVWLLLVFCVFTPAGLAAERKSFPPTSSLEAAKKLVAEVFREEIAASDKVPAVRAMLAAAAKTEGDDVAQVALYLSAADLAAQAGETKLAFEALERLAAGFDLDLLALKQNAMESAAKSARTNDSKISVGNRCLELADEAAKANRFDIAESVLKIASAATAKIRDAELRKEITNKRREVERTRRQAEQEQAALAAARETLKEHPDDREANELLGKHLCFDKHDWKAGVKHLARAADGELQKAALAEQSGATEPSQAATLGDWWWALGEQAKTDRDTAGYRSRAVFWYTRAVDSLTGLQRALVEKRIKDAGDEALYTAAQQNGDDNAKFVDIALAPGVLLRLVKIPASADGAVKTFYMGQTEVTQSQWKAVMGTEPVKPQSLGERMPICMVSYHDCLAFAAALSKKTPRYEFRLPMKKEWVHAYACGGDPSTVSLKNRSEVAWCKENSGMKMHDVATKAANSWGLFDMLGNAQEWTADKHYCGICYADSFKDEILRNYIPNPSKNAPDAKWISMGFRVAAEAK